MIEEENHYNVCGILICVNTQNLEEVSQYLNGLEGCEIIQDDKKNKIAATVEDTATNSAYDLMEKIKNHNMVLSVTLINHFFDEISD